jgi:hypothetical protein
MVFQRFVDPLREERISIFSETTFFPDSFVADGPALDFMIMDIQVDRKGVLAKPLAAENLHLALPSLQVEPIKRGWPVTLVVRNNSEQRLFKATLSGPSFE